MQSLRRLAGLSWAVLWLCPSLAAAPQEVLEGFEGRHFWQLAPWSDEAKAIVSEEQASEGKKALEIHFSTAMANRKKGIVLERDLSSLGREFNRLNLDVYSEGPAKILVAIAVETDEYFESQALPLEKGWNKDLSFVLTSRTFKAKSTNWKFETSVNLSSPLKKISLIFYREGPENEGTFFVDRMVISEEERPLEESDPPGVPSKVIERGKKNHYRPRGLPIEIFIRS